MGQLVPKPKELFMKRICLMISFLSLACFPMMGDEKDPTPQPQARVDSNQEDLQSIDQDEGNNHPLPKISPRQRLNPKNTC